MKRDVHYFNALPYRVINGYENETEQHIIQNMDFVQLKGYGDTHANAVLDLKNNQRQLIFHMLATQDGRVPLPTHHDEAKSKAIWDAAADAFLEAFEALGVHVVTDGTEDALTLAKRIVEKTAIWKAKQKRVKKVRS